jgi:hypothetical protein
MMMVFNKLLKKKLEYLQFCSLLLTFLYPSIAKMLQRFPIHDVTSVKMFQNVPDLKIPQSSGRLIDVP